MEKYNKISSKIYKHLVYQKVQQKVQQKVHQKVHNIYVPLFRKRFVFEKWNFPTSTFNTRSRI